MDIGQSDNGAFRKGRKKRKKKKRKEKKTKIENKNKNKRGRRKDVNILLSLLPAPDITLVLRSPYS